MQKIELGLLEKSKRGMQRKIESVKIYNVEGMKIEEITYANSLVKIESLF